MAIDDKIRNKKLQYDVNKEAALLSGKTDKYEYLTGEEILQSDQNRIKEQARFTYCTLSKACEKQGKKQGETLEVLKPNNQKLIIEDAISKNLLNGEAKNELNKIKEIEKAVNG